ncbi:MAG: hypothetical protein KBG33_03265 [Paludibacteraceae bacterium]|nr:hypothetical protein [Paludibacteraceae bacterium]OPZ01316.1 MAG: hypothetical protein BWZ11_01749 [Bacteroidetes bacterium ADurb.BinA395]HOL29496.1 hypothetical protein [Paludibacteraceae bacterium]HPD59650.1 hypothetical protein [Paludibacteraceae bacterium]HQG68226.1 hypothetical protein [Paludibacteraceae bacterium]
MNTLLKPILILFLMVISINTLIASNPIKYNQSNKEVLPENLKVLVRDSFCDYSIPTENQFIDEWKTYEHITKPMFAFSDFNGDSKNDYAVLLLSEKFKNVIIVVFLSGNNDYSYTIYRIKKFDLNSNLIDVFISIEKKGYWECANGKKYIKHDGIRVDLASESLSFSYYWANSIFRKFLCD